MNNNLIEEITEQLTIRPLHPDDHRAIFQMLKNSIIVGALPYTPGTEYLHISDYLAKRDPNDHRYVAESEGRIIGFMKLIHKTRPRLNHSGAIVLAIDSRFHYEQVRNSLMAAGLAIADNWLNLIRVEIEPVDWALEDIDYFKSIGFKVEGNREKAIFQNGKWINQLLMARVRIPTHPSEKSKTTNIQKRSVGKKTRRPVENIEIRPSEIDDANAFHEMMLDPAICRTTLQLPSQEIWQIEEKLRDSQSWLHRFTAIADGKIVGRIAMVQDQMVGRSHIAHIGMAVHQDYWGYGIGYKLVEAVTDLADNWLNTIRIELEVHTDNPAGIRLYEKSGFVIEGTKRYQAFGDGRWADSYFMARIKEKNINKAPFSGHQAPDLEDKSTP